MSRSLGADTVQAIICYVEKVVRPATLSLHVLGERGGRRPYIRWHLTRSSYSIKDSRSCVHICCTDCCIWQKLAMLMATRFKTIRCAAKRCPAFLAPGDHAWRVGSGLSERRYG
eukprot:3751353-Pleurochrysis_carterae.AAC.1